MDPAIVRSARTHGSPDDMLHAYRNPIRVFDLDDLTMLVGSGRAGEVLEIGLATAQGIDFIVHAMPAGPKFLE